MTLTAYDILVLVGIPAISAFIFQVVYNAIASRFKRGKNESIMIKQALQALLRDRLREHYTQFIKQSYIPIEDKENFDNMYQIYHALGKNGVMDDMYKKVMRLPTSAPEKKSIKQKLNEGES